MKTILILLMIPLVTFADISVEEILIEKPEKHLRNDALIYNLNTKLGIRDQRYFTQNDENRLSGALHLAGDYERLNNLIGFEVNYFNRFDNFPDLWWGLQGFRYQTRFNHISNNPSQTLAGQEIPNDAKQDLLGFGIGGSYRFRLLLDFFPTQNWFENIEVFINYVKLAESEFQQNYTGYGFTTSYGLHKRMSSWGFAGLKFNYHFTPVTRPATNNEGVSNRSLSLGWFTIAFETGVFF